MILRNLFSEKLRKIEEICLVCGRLFFCYREAGSADERSSNGRTGFTVVESPAYFQASFLEYALARLDIQRLDQLMEIIRESAPIPINKSFKRDNALRALLVT